MEASEWLARKVRINIAADWTPEKSFLVGERSNRDFSVNIFLKVNAQNTQDIAHWPQHG